MQWKNGSGVLRGRGLCPPRVSQEGVGVNCLSVSTVIRAGKGAGAATLGWAAPGVGSQQEAGGRVWGAEAQGTQQLLLWHKGAEGTPFWRVSQAAGAGGWVDWRCSSARGPVEGPRRLHSYLQKFSVTRGVWFNVSLCSLGW